VRPRPDHVPAKAASCETRSPHRVRIGRAPCSGNRAASPGVYGGRREREDLAENQGQRWTTRFSESPRHRDWMRPQALVCGRPVATPDAHPAKST
jgi:hypothetical protein